jgi:hypothetical protein
LHSALSTADNWGPLADALSIPRSAACRLARAAVACATSAGAAVTAGSLAQLPSLVLCCSSAEDERCQLAIMSVNALSHLLTVCEPPHTALEVTAAAAPAEQLMPLLHNLSCVLLTALEAGEHHVVASQLSLS